jgi:hypothetical protein
LLLLSACSGQSSDSSGSSGSGGGSSGGSANSGGNAGSSGGSSSGSSGTGGSGGSSAGAGGDAGAAGVSCDARDVVCRAAAPVCAEFEVPSVEGQCWGACVAVDLCVCSGPDDCPEPETYTCHNFRQRCGPYL